MRTAALRIALFLACGGFVTAQDGEPQEPPVPPGDISVELESPPRSEVVLDTDTSQPEEAPAIDAPENLIEEPPLPDESPSASGKFQEQPQGLSLYARQGYDSNVFTSYTDPSGSLYSNLGGALEYETASPRLDMVGSLTAGLTYYYSIPYYQYEFNGAFSLRLAYRPNARWTLTLVTSTSYLPQPDIATPGATNQYNGSFIYSTTTLGANYLWSRKVATETKYNFTPVYYFDQAYNDQQGRVEQTFGQSIQWLVNPKTKLLLEYRANPVTYFSAPLDNFGQFALVGMDQVFNPRAKGDARLGVEQRFYNSENDNRSYLGPFAEFNVSYEYKKFSALTANLRYGTEASGIGGSATRDTFRLGLGVVHGVTPKLSFSASVNYQNNYYNEFDKNVTYPDFTENVIQFSLGANFQWNKLVGLELGYTYTNDSAPEFIAPALAYERNMAFVGIRISY